MLCVWTKVMNNTEIKIEDFKDVSMMDIKKAEEHHQWYCCSGTKSDSRLIRFISIYFIILLVFIFCLVMLFNAKTCEDTTGYMALLTMLLGVIIPNPK